MGGPGSGGARPGSGRPRSGKRAPRRQVGSVTPISKTTHRVTLDSESLESDLEALAKKGVGYALLVMDDPSPELAADRLALTKIIVARLSRSLVEDETEERNQEMRGMLAGLVREATGSEGMGTVTELAEVLLETDRDD